MTCPHCGMTIGWDCECDEEYNRLVDAAYDADELGIDPEEDYD